MRTVRGALLASRRPGRHGCSQASSLLADLADIASGFVSDGLLSPRPAHSAVGSEAADRQLAVTSSVLALPALPRTPPVDSVALTLFVRSHKETIVASTASTAYPGHRKAACSGTVPPIPVCQATRARELLQRPRRDQARIRKRGKSRDTSRCYPHRHGATCAHSDWHICR